MSLCNLADLADGEPHRFDADGRRICVVRIGDTVYALDDRCSHQDYSLSEGLVNADEQSIECPKHGSSFGLATGEALSLPATKPVQAYRVEIKGGRVGIADWA